MLRKKYLKLANPSLQSLHELQSYRNIREVAYSDENQDRNGASCEQVEDTLELKYKVLPRKSAKNKENSVHRTMRDGINRAGSLDKQFKLNQQKIEKLSFKLEELYIHYQTQTDVYNKRRTQIEQINQVESENIQLQEDIRKVKELLQKSLLGEEMKRLKIHFPN